jgi:hypothetical protein
MKIWIILTALLVFSESQNLPAGNDPTLDPANDKLFFIRNIDCTFKTCAVPNECVDESTCKCALGTANFPQIAAGPFCQYKQLNQLTGFLLQFFVFHGAGQFYLGNLNLAIPQLILCLLVYLIPCISAFSGNGFFYKRKEGGRSKFALVLLILHIIICSSVFAWWLAEAIVFGVNKYYDSTGVPLASW